MCSQATYHWGGLKQAKVLGKPWGPVEIHMLPSWPTPQRRDCDVTHDSLSHWLGAAWPAGQEGGEAMAREHLSHLSKGVKYMVTEYTESEL